MPRASTAPVDADRLTRLRSAVVAARVGGTFWAPPCTVAAEMVLAPQSPAEAAAMIGLAAGRRAVALLPTVRWARRTASAFAGAGVAVHCGAVDPWSALAGARIVHASDASELALIAHLCGIAVRLGDPHRADTDAAAISRRLGEALLGMVTYRDCFTGEVVEAEAAVALLGFWRATIERNRGIAALAGVAWWKRREVTAMLWDGRVPPARHLTGARRVVAAASRGSGAVAVWPSRAPRGLAARAGSAGVPVVRVEDGFVRSVGLGSALHPPFSVAVDRLGIYYDASRPSDLEAILAATDFPAALIARGRRLMETIVAAGISKYASGRGRYDSLPCDRRTVLVTGQVEDDLSVRLGGGGVAGNLDLLRRARAAEPDAFIIFKPHPDVEAGHRRGHVSDADLIGLADRIERTAAMPALLDAVDAVHVWTSLAGFEALIRGREVITHGQPFYAGWGLTRDLAPPVARRGRTLRIEALVAGTLILYPRYLDPVTRLPCTPEILISRLTGPHSAGRTPLIVMRRWQGLARRALRRRRRG